MLDMPGPRRTPTANLKLAGSRLADDRAKTEPDFKNGVGPCPRWLDKDSKKEWRRLVPILGSAGVLQYADADALARYCRTLTRFKRMQDIVESKGEIYQAVDYRGNDLGPRQRPEVAILDHLSNQLGKLECEFALTPASRSRVETTKNKKTTTKSRFFNKQA